MYLSPQRLIEGHHKCKADRANSENVWQKIGDYIVPLQNDIQSQKSPGEAKFNKIYDATAMISNELLAGALHGMLTSPTSPFFNLTTGDPVLDQKDPVRRWIQSTVRRMHDQINNSNFQTEIHEYYISLCGFGNGALFIEEDVRDVVRFSCRPIKEVFVKENSKNKIDTIYRSFKLTPQGLYEEYGEKSLPEKIKDAFKNGKTDEYEVLHAIYPRDIAVQQYQAMADDQKKMVDTSKDPGPKFSFLSQHVLVSEKSILDVKGYREWPAPFGRWSKVAGEPYGRGCGEKALPDTLTLNEMTRITLVGAQKAIDPPVQMPDDGFVMPLKTRSGGVNYYRAGSPATDRVTPIFSDSKVDFGFQMIDRKQASIREAFYVNQLQLRDGPQMTAAEVNQRVEQALRFLAPMLGRQTTEVLAPTIERVYGIMSRRNLFDPIPAELQNVLLKIQYSSVMAMTQRQSEMMNINRGLQALAPLSAFDPSVTDIIDGTASAKYVLGLNNYPQEGIRNEEGIKQVRQERQQAQEQAAQQEQAAAGAKTVADVSKAAANIQPKTA